MTRRLTKLEYYFGLVDASATLATCGRGRSGAVIVRDGGIIATGYVGSPPGEPHCDEVGHDFEVSYNKAGEEINHCVRTTHAEMNALMWCTKFGISTNGASIYCTMFPCFTCAKLIVAAGIHCVMAQFDYQSSERSKHLFTNLNVHFEIMNKEKKSYE